MSIISNALFGFEIGNDYFFFDNNSECAVFFIELKCGSVFCDETDTVFLIDGIGKFDGWLHRLLACHTSSALHVV